MAERGRAFNAFLREGAALPFLWGERDCTLWVADWIARVRGIDPAKAQRGTYATAGACRRLLVREGGLVALATASLARCGFAVTDAPVVGDVGVVCAPAGPTMAICTGGSWAIKTIDGIVVFPAHPIKSWSI